MNSVVGGLGRSEWNSEAKEIICGDGPQCRPSQAQKETSKTKVFDPAMDENLRKELVPPRSMPGAPHARLWTAWCRQALFFMNVAPLMQACPEQAHVVYRQRH